MARQNTKKRDQQIIKSYQDGELSIYEIAEKAGITIGTIYNVLSRNNVELRKEKRKIRTKINQLKVVNKFKDEGLTYEGLSKEFSVSRTTVGRLLNGTPEYHEEKRKKALEKQEKLEIIVYEAAIKKYHSFKILTFHHDIPETSIKHILYNKGRSLYTFLSDPDNIKLFLDDGLDIKQLAKKYGMTEKLVSRIIEDNKIK